MKNHWERVYDGKSIDKLGWYQTRSEKTIEMIEELQLDKNSRIFIAGAGSTYLVDHLYFMGYNNLIVNDISKFALDNIKNRLPEAKLMYIEDSITSDTLSINVDPIDLWQDRALLHFLIDDKDQKAYVENLNKLLKIGGYVIISVFNLNGADRCSGLEVKKYSAESLSKLLGSNYKLVKSFDYMYTTPSGDPRPYVYALFQRHS